MTNFERWRQMPVEEIADEVSCFAECEYCPARSKVCIFVGCDKAWEKWLNEEVQKQNDD